MAADDHHTTAEEREKLEAQQKGHVEHG